MKPPAHHRHTRRQFIQKTAAAAGALAGANLLHQAGAAQRTSAVSIVFDPADAVVKQSSVRWAAERLRDTLRLRGVAAEFREALEQVPVEQACICVASRTSKWAREIIEAARLSMPHAAEATAFVPAKVAKHSGLLISGSDARGVTYGLLEVADRVDLSDESLAGLNQAKPILERPANVIRSISRSFTSVPICLMPGL